MSAEPRAQTLTPAEVALLASQQALEEQVEQLKYQLAWFKKQLFGRKSERRLIELSPQQLSLGERAPALGRFYGRATNLIHGLELTGPDQVWGYGRRETQSPEGSGKKAPTLAGPGLCLKAWR